MTESVQITEIKVGEKTYQLADLPDSIKVLVSGYEFAVSKLKQAEKEYQLANAATRTLYSEITNAIQSYSDEYENRKAIESSDSSDSSESTETVEEVSAE